MGIATTPGSTPPPYDDSKRWRNLRTAGEPAPVKVTWLPEEERKPPTRKRKKRKKRTNGYRHESP